jgi:hypothetical protein
VADKIINPSAYRAGNPIYALACREWTEDAGGVPVVTDASRLRTVESEDYHAVLLFTDAALAEEHARLASSTTTVVATFRGERHLIECLKTYIGSPVPWLIFDIDLEKCDGHEVHVLKYLDELDRHLDGGR